MTDEVQKINNTTDEILKMLQKMLEQTIEFEKKFISLIQILK